MVGLDIFKLIILAVRAIRGLRRVTVNCHYTMPPFIDGINNVHPRIGPGSKFLCSGGEKSSLTPLHIGGNCVCGCGRCD